MNRHATKPLFWIVVVVLVLSVAGCGETAGPTAAPTQNTASTAKPIQESTEPSATQLDTPEPVTFTFYVGDYWQSCYIDPSWTDPVAQELTRRTGVTLDVSIPASNDDESEMNKMIAANDLTDLIFRGGGDSKETLQNGGYVKPLDDLIEQYAPNIKAYHEGTFGAWRNRKDGKIYCIGFWYFNKVVKAALNLQVTTLQMRYDVLKQMGYEKLDRSEGDMNSFITLDEYYGLLDRVKTEYPDMVPVLAEPYNAMNILYLGMGKQMHKGYLWENNQATDFVNSTDALWVMEEVNGFFQQDYADINDYMTTEDVRKAKLSDGEVFSCLGYASLISQIQGTLSEGNDEKRFVMFYLRTDESVENIYMNGAWGDSAAGVHINAKLDDGKTIRAMEFLDYCAGPEGSLLVNAGIEGVDYFPDPETGWYKPEETIFEAYRVWDPAVFKVRGVGGWLNILPNIAGITEDGHCYDINAEYAFSQDRWVMYNNSDWEHFAYQMIISPYTQFDNEGQADAIDANSKIEAYRRDRMTNIMLLTDASAIEDELSDLREQIEQDGIGIVEQAQTDNWLQIANEKGRAPENINETMAQSAQGN